MKKKFIPILILVLLLAGGTVYWLQQRETAEEESGNLRLYGNVDIREAHLAFFGTGRVAQLSAKEGDRVEAGQVLAMLDDTRQQLAVDRAEAQLVAQQQLVARLKAGSRPEEIAEARARVRAADAARRETENRLRRVSALAQDDYLSKQKLDDAETAFDGAKAQLEALQQVAAMVVQGPRTEDVEAAVAQEKALAAARDLARREWADTKLIAPTNGVIRNRLLEVGDMASPQRPVYSLALNDPVWVRAYLPEPDMGKIRPGMKAFVTTDSFPDKEYEGWVGYMSPTAEFTPKQIETADLRTRLVYQIRVFVSQSSHELRLGMPASVRIPLEPDAAPAPGK